ncbi:MAG: Omp28-related outer membrane protein [Bacteroidota bacterium]|jgi:hypothetical protein
MRLIFLSIILSSFYSKNILAQGSDTKQNGLVVKLSATWCPVCSGAAWNSYSWLLNNVKNNAFYFTAHSSSTSRLFSQTSLDIIRNFDVSAYQPAFYLNGLNKGSGGSVTEREIKNGIEDAVIKEPVALLKTVARATGNTSIKAQVTLTFPKVMTGNYTMGLYLIEKVVKEVQTGLSGTVDHKNVLRNSFFTQSFGEDIPGTSFSAGYSKTITGAINLPINSLASNFEVIAVLWKKNGVKYDFVNVHGTSDMAGVLTGISEKVNENFRFVLTNASLNDIEFQFSSLSMPLKDVTVHLRDILGRSVKQENGIQFISDFQKMRFSNLNLTPGTYVISFESREFLISRKVMVK